MLTLIDPKVEINTSGVTVGWWLFELNKTCWNVIGFDLLPDSAIPPEWAGLVHHKAYEILDADERYVGAVPRLKDVADFIKSHEIPAMWAAA